MSDYLSEEEQLARARSLWKEYGTTILVAFGVAVAGIIGWQVWQNQQAADIAAGADLYVAYEEAGDDTRDALAQRISTEFAGSSYEMMVLFDQAKRAIEEDNLAGARTHLRKIADTAPDALLGDLARVRLAKVIYGMGEPELALSTLTQIKSSGYRSMALETQGDIQLAEGDVENAHASFKAAADLLIRGQERPLLNIKVANTAPFNGTYVERESALSDALEEARDVIEQAEQAAAEASEAATEATAPADGAEAEVSEAEASEADGG